MLFLLGGDSLGVEHRLIEGQIESPYATVVGTLLGAVRRVPKRLTQVAVGDGDQQAAGDVVQPAEAVSSGLETGEAGESEDEELELVEVADDPVEEPDRRTVGRPVSAPTST